MMLFANNTFFTHLGGNNNFRKPRHHTLLLKDLQATKVQVTISKMSQPYFCHRARMNIFNLQRKQPILTHFHNSNNSFGRIRNFTCIIPLDDDISFFQQLTDTQQIAFQSWNIEHIRYDLHTPIFGSKIYITLSHHIHSR